MRRTTALCVAAAALMVAGCALTGDPRVSTVGMPGQLEPVHAAAFTHDTALFRVSSNGCTSKADVQPFITHTGDSAVITLRRVDEDRCSDVRSDGVQLQWSFEELGLEPGAEVSVNNPYMMPQDSAANGAS